MGHIDHLKSIYDLNGKTVADIGAGKGHFVKQLASCGADVTGIEIEAGKVAAAQARMPEGARFLQGRGEALPLETGTQDLVCFMYSFHHIPMDVQDEAILEAIRVLKPAGYMHVVEPMPESCMNDPMKLIDDETEVRTRSHARFQSLPDEGVFKLVQSEKYLLSYGYNSFDAFVDGIIGVDPERAAKLPAARDDMERLFHQHARFENGSYCFENPCTAYHFVMI